MKTLNFKFWKYFIPIYGFGYLLWYGHVTTRKKNRYKGDLDKVYDHSILFYLLFICYSTVHVIGFGLLCGWIASLTGLI